MSEALLQTGSEETPKTTLRELDVYKINIHEIKCLGDEGVRYLSIGEEKPQTDSDGCRSALWDTAMLWRTTI